jgi:hypothetical protein
MIIKKIGGEENNKNIKNHKRQISILPLNVNNQNEDRLEVEYDEDNKDEPIKIEIPVIGKDISPPKTQEKQIEITQNFCTLCKSIQSLRSKHCRVCDKCVATFDHHCIWLGNCIGEKNRPIFFCYLILQYIHCCWSLINVFFYKKDYLDYTRIFLGR